MKCAICHLSIKIYDFDIGNAFKGLNPLTFRNCSMHFDCYEDALDVVKEMPSSKSNYQNRYDEFLTTKI